MYKVNTTLATGLAILLLYTPISQARAISDINVQYIRSAVNNPVTDRTLNGDALAATLGFNLHCIYPLLTLEAEYSSSSNPASYEKHTHYNFGILGGKYDYDYKETVDYTTIAGYAVLTIPVGDRQRFRVRAGVDHLDMEIKVREITNGRVTQDTTDTRSKDNFSYGLGVLYTLSEHTSFILDATSIDSRVTHVGVGLQIVF